VDALSRFGATFLNAVWQVALIAALALVAGSLLRRAGTLLSHPLGGSGHRSRRSCSPGKRDLRTPFGRLACGSSVDPSWFSKLEQGTTMRGLQFLELLDTRGNLCSRT
jgi:hypothetical protein